MSVFAGVAATKLSYFSDRKLGISVPIQGESSDILNVGEEKNDYDWLVFYSFLILYTSHGVFITFFFLSTDFNAPYCKNQLSFFS